MDFEIYAPVIIVALISLFMWSDTSFKIINKRLDRIERNSEIIEVERSVE